MTELDDFRKLKDDFFANHPDSPLTDEQKRDFKGFKYFPENPALRLEVQIEEFPEKDTIEMQTSTGEIQVYQRFGRIRFPLEEGKPL